MDSQFREASNITQKAISGSLETYNNFQPARDFASNLGARNPDFESFLYSETASKLLSRTKMEHSTIPYLDYPSIVSKVKMTVPTPLRFNQDLINIVGVSQYKHFSETLYSNSIELYSETISIANSFVNSFNTRNSWSAKEIQEEIQDIYSEVQVFPISEEIISNTMNSEDFQRFARIVLYPLLVVYCVINFDLVKDIINQLGVIFGIASYFKNDKK